MNVNLIVTIAILIPTVALSIIVHEVAHGWVAYRLGDSTAKNLGRLTLNPLPHIDIIGTVLLPLIMYFTAGAVFGWAKPVPFNPHNFHRHIDVKKGTMWVALAGPGSNLIIAFLASFILVLVKKIVPSSHPFLYYTLVLTAQAFVTINICLAILNLIPIPPLDGSKVVMRFLPSKYYSLYLRLERYGFLILIILLISGGLSLIVQGPINFFEDLFVLIPEAIFNG
jgi:Zn-dependent protease